MEIANGEPVQFVSEEIDFGELVSEKIGDGSPKGRRVGSGLSRGLGFEFGGPGDFGQGAGEVWGAFDRQEAVR